MVSSPGEKRISGRYLLRQRLGEGGCGVVWQAWDEEARRPVAVKVLKLRTPQAERRLQREARITIALRHPNIVHVDSAILFNDEDADDEQQLALVMELMQGESLANVLTRRKTLPLAMIAEIFVPVLEAVEFAHAAGVVHRDLKPDNVFIARVDGGRVVPKVLDFGVAKLTSMNGVLPMSLTTTATAPQMLLGTPAYMAPEQIVDGSHVDARTDIWALGVMLFECLTGRLPFEGQNVGELFREVVTQEPQPIERFLPSLPKDVIALVHEMLVRDPSRRIAKVRDVRRVLAAHKRGDLASLLEGKPSLRPSDAPFEVDVDVPTEVFTFRPPSRRGPLVAGACAAAALVGFLSVGFVAERRGVARVEGAPSFGRPANGLEAAATGRRSVHESASVPVTAPRSGVESAPSPVLTGSIASPVRSPMQSSEAEAPVRGREGRARWARAVALGSAVAPASPGVPGSAAPSSASGTAALGTGPAGSSSGAVGSSGAVDVGATNVSGAAPSSSAAPKREPTVPLMDGRIIRSQL